MKLIKELFWMISNRTWHSSIDSSYILSESRSANTTEIDVVRVFVATIGAYKGGVCELNDTLTIVAFW